MNASMHAATQKVLDECFNSHDTVRKAWTDAVARLYYALSVVPGAALAEPADEEVVLAV